MSHPDCEPAKCSLMSWLCADNGIYNAAKVSPCRFIWCSRFDEYGRIGSPRHAMYRAKVIDARVAKVGIAMVFGAYEGRKGL